MAVAEETIDCTVGEIAAPIRNALVGGPFGSDLGTADYVPSGVPVIRGQNLSVGKFVGGEFVYVSDAKATKLTANLARPGDLVFTQRGNAVLHGGQVAIVPKGPFDRYVVSQSQMKLSPDPAKVDSEFLYVVFTSGPYRHYLRSNAIVTGVPHINLRLLRNYPLSLPSLAEQKAISAVLGALDDKIELNRRMNATLEAMARALFQSWFVDFDPVRAKLDARPPTGIDKTTAALFPDSFDESSLGPIPHGWTVGTIEDATSLIIDYRGRTPKKMGSDWSVTGIPAVSAKNVKGGRLVRPEMFNFVSEELYGRWMKDKLALGDILMTSEAPLGELYYLALDARFCLSQRIFAMRANPVRCEPTFLYYWLESPGCQTEIINRGTGTTVEGIRQTELRKVSVLLPPLPIQKAATKFLAAWTEQIHRNEEQSRTLATLRDTLLPKLLSGELSVVGAERFVTVGQTNSQARDSAHVGTRTAVLRLAPTHPSTERKQASPEPTRRVEPTAVATPDITEIETDDVMAAFRQALRGRGTITREELMKDVSQRLGFQRLGTTIREHLKGHIRAAIRRKIVGTQGPEEVFAQTSTIADYTRDELIDFLCSVIPKNHSLERCDAIIAVTHHLGFRRVSDTIKNEIKSAINGGIRRKVLDHQGELIWRVY